MHIAFVNQLCMIIPAFLPFLAEREITCIRSFEGFVCSSVLLRRSALCGSLWTCSVRLHEIALCGFRSIEIDQKSEIDTVMQLPSRSGERLNM